MTQSDVSGTLTQLTAADRHRPRPVRLAYGRVYATQPRRRVARTSGGSGIAADHVTGVRRLRGEVVEGDVDALAGQQSDEPRRLAGATAGVCRDDARQVAGLVGDDDRPQRVAQSPLRRYH